MLVTAFATTPSTNDPKLVGALLANVLIEPETTVLSNVAVCPPIFNAKLAVPAPDGVPEILYTRLPAPLANVPFCNVAVSPVIPVDVII